MLDENLPHNQSISKCAAFCARTAAQPLTWPLLPDSARIILRLLRSRRNKRRSPNRLSGVPFSGSRPKVGHPFAHVAAGAGGSNRPLCDGRHIHRGGDHLTSLPYAGLSASRGDNHGSAWRRRTADVHDCHPHVPRLAGRIDDARPTGTVYRLRRQ
jgi:hypothetical protein